MERIVAAVDGSAASSKALEFAADLAGKYGAELVLLTVAQEVAPVLSPEMQAYARAEHIEDLTSDPGFAAADSVLAGARLTARATGAARVTTETGSGDPAEAIIALAKDRHADLIVMGTRGHGRIAGLLLGSVAQKVVTHAACPVLVVP
jgi:nucleotide-binding universal stress UspA family protein